MSTVGELIVESNDDLEIWSSIEVDFDMFKNLVISLEHINYDAREYDYTLDMIIDKEDALEMAAFLHTELINLPKVIFKKFGVQSNLFVPSEVEKLFKEIMDFVLDCGAHYKLKRTGAE